MLVLRNNLKIETNLKLNLQKIVYKKYFLLPNSLHFNLSEEITNKSVYYLITETIFILD